MTDSKKRKQPETPTTSDVGAKKPHLAEDVDWSPLDAVEIEGTDIK